MTKAPELKPCPFCGGEAKAGFRTDSSGQTEAFVSCWSCLCGMTQELDWHMTPAETEKEKAEIVASWNSRADLALAAEAAALERAAKECESLLPERGAAEPQDKTERLIDAARRDDVRAIRDLITSAQQSALDAYVADRIKGYMQPLTDIMPNDFKDWHENSPEEWPLVAASTITGLRDREDLAWENATKVTDRIAALEAELAEARRRRDEWRKKAEGYDEVRRALREKVGAPWPPHMSRALWAGIAADEKKRADDAEAQLAEAKEALRPFAFTDDATTQEAWETRYRDRFKDWIDFDDIDRARGTLAKLEGKANE